MKIGILGIGGVGGFVGAALAGHYRYNASDVKIVFICRGATRSAIRSQGLLVQRGNKRIRVFPHLVSDDPHEIGKLDFLIVAAKSYGLVSALRSYEDCLDPKSTVVTLQNMVNAKELVQGALSKEFDLLEGCIYVAANRVAPGQVDHLGGPGNIIFGGRVTSDRVQEFTDKLKRAGIDTAYHRHIKEHLWRKYLFVAPVTAVTTAYDVTFGAIAADHELLRVLRAMMMELKGLANKKNVGLTDGDVDDAMAMLSKFPFGAKSSLQLDHERRNPSEYHYLVEYILEACKREGLGCPVYESIHTLIQTQRDMGGFNT